MQRYHSWRKSLGNLVDLKICEIPHRSVNVRAPFTLLWRNMAINKECPSNAAHTLYRMFAYGQQTNVGNFLLFVGFQELQHCVQWQHCNLATEGHIWPIFFCMLDFMSCITELTDNADLKKKTFFRELFNFGNTDLAEKVHKIQQIWHCNKTA